MQKLIQATLDDFGAGILVTQVQLLKVDPPADVIASFRDVQAARADQERIQNEAQTYSNKVVPEARGQASQITEAANAYRDRIIAEAKGQADRFDKVYESYTAAPDVTRRRMYLETIEGVFGGMDKIILDEKGAGTGVVPYLPLDSLDPRTAGDREAANEARHLQRPRPRRSSRSSASSLYLSVFIVDQTEQALVLRFGDPVRVINAPPNLAATRPIPRTARPASTPSCR